jgi:hypothetical protein
LNAFADNTFAELVVLANDEFVAAVVSEESVDGFAVALAAAVAVDRVVAALALGRAVAAVAADILQSKKVLVEIAHSHLFS